MNNRMENIASYLDQVSKLVSKLPEEKIEKIIAELYGAFMDGKQVLLCGNGGSASTASHFAGDLQKTIGNLTERKFRVLALTDSLPILTAWGNDTEYANIFSAQVATWARPDDLLIAISGSGNSPNILRAVETASKLGMKTIGLTGMGGGKLAGMVDLPLVVDSDNMQHIEDAHVVLAHLIYSCLYKEIDPSK